MRDSPWLLLAAGGVAGALAACAALRVLRSRVHDVGLRQHDWQVASTLQPQTAAGLDKFLQDEVLAEQFTRNVQFFGKEGQLKVAKAFVVVIGLGVGTNADTAQD